MIRRWRMSSRLVAAATLVTIPSLVATGCVGGSSQDDATQGSATATATETGTATEGPGDTTTNPNETDAVDTDGTGPTTADSSSSATETDGETTEPATWEAVLQLSSRVVLESDDGGGLVASCVVLNEGLPYDGDSTSTLSVMPMRGVTMGPTILFDEFGTYVLTCEVEVEGQMLSTSAEISVLNEAIEPALTGLGEGMSELETALHAVLDSDMEDDAVLVAAQQALVAAMPKLEAEPYVELTDVLRRIPGDWPTPAALNGFGIAPSPDDDALPAAMTALDGELVALEQTLGGIDPANLTDADLEALTERTVALQAVFEQLEALEPTAHGMLATRAQATTLLRDRVRGSAAAQLAFTDGLVQAQAARLFAPVPIGGLAHDPDPQRFGFLSLAIGSFGQSYLQIQLVNQWYGEYIAELDKSINNLILIGGIDYFLPPDPNGPVIDYLVASASLGFATPGYPSWVDGYNFHEDPETNLFLVIGDQWQGVIENIFTACGVEEADTVPEKIYVVLECIEEIEGAVESLFLYPMSVGPGIYGSQQGLDLGEFPEACSGPLPVAIGLIPINLAIGRGPSYLINCIG